MTELKTRPTDAKVADFLAEIADPGRREECLALVDMMLELTGEPPRMWGRSIVGFGSYHYRYRSGREGDWFVLGFSPRKQNLTLYFMCEFDEHPALMERLGKYKTGKSCLYVKRLTDLDREALRELIRQSVEQLPKSSDPSRSQ